MAALAILRQTDTARGLSQDRAIAAFARQGFAAPEVMKAGTATVLWFDSPYASARSTNYIRFEQGFVACVGDLAYRGQRGQAALTMLWQDFRHGEALERSELYGNFQLVLCNAFGTWLFGDELGLIQLFASHDGSYISTSWLSCLLLQEHPLIDRLGAQDYVLNGASHGHKTLVRDISVLPGGYQLDLASGVDTKVSASSWLNRFEYTSQEQAVDLVSQSLAERTSRFLGHDDAGVITALSAGYDSRLILAALISARLSAELFVYGRADDEDVLIARDLAETIGLPIKVIDKSSIDSAHPAITLDQIESNAAFFDGTPIDGLFDRGSDRFTRTKHAESGKMQLNGGGGEIFRNFFYLGNRRYTPTELVQCFYHQFPRDVFPGRSSYNDYVDSMAADIREAVGHATGSLSRTEVEAVYPLFRLRFWTSRTNSIVARYGRYYTPLVDPILVRQALALPLQWKHFGRFEARLIKRLNPALASRPLSYGFTPAAGPDLAYRLKMRLQHARPPRLRSLTPAIKRLLGGGQRHAVRPPGLAAERPIDTIIRIEKLQNSAQINRAHSLMALIKIFGIDQQ